MAQRKPPGGGQPNPVEEKSGTLAATEAADEAAFSAGKRNNLTFRVDDQLKSDLERAAAASQRSVSGQIEYWLRRAPEWERAINDVEAFRAHLANSKERLAEEERQIVEMSLQRQGWAKLHTRYGSDWFAPGTHNIPQSGFVDPNAPPTPTLPPVLAEAVRAEVQSAVRAEVQSVVREILQEAGLLSQTKKSGGTAA
jgi:hypothetical protein